MSPAAVAGLVMLAAAVGVYAGGRAAVAPGARRVRRRWASLRRRWALSRWEVARLQAGLAAARAEHHRLRRPLHRAWRWVRHPLVAALWASFRRRRRARRLARARG